MAVINETLRLTDGFSSPMLNIVKVTQQASDRVYMLDRNLSKAMGHAAGATIGSIRALTEETQKTNELLSKALEKQKRVKKETQDTAKASGDWLSTVRNVAAAIGGISLIKGFLGASDQMSQIDSKLKSIAGSEAAALALQEQIYLSSQRSRSSYSDTANLVTRIGTNAREAFGDTSELVQFAENLNKSFVTAGATQQEQAAATLQLTQALASGVLRGEELNSVFEAAPNIIRTIADYLDVPIGQIREMASEGQLTAEVVKNAMLAATDDINESFEDMPMTLSQAFQVGKNAIQQSLREAFAGWSDFIASDKGQKILNKLIGTFQVLAQVGVNALELIGQAALFVYDNMDYILPFVIALATAYLVAGAASVASGLAAAAAWAAANWPLVLLVAVLSTLIFVLRQTGVSWQQMGEVAGAVFGFLYAWAYQVVAFWWNLFATFAEFFANVFDNPVRAIVHLFQGLLDTILSVVESVAGAIDTLLGSNLSGAIAGFRSTLSNWVDETFGENAVQIKRMANLDVESTVKQFSMAGGNLAGKLDNANFSLDSIASSLSGFDPSSIPTVSGAGGLGDVGSVGSVGSVKSIEGDVKLSDEDMKIYRDLAERRYMNNVELQTLAPNITVTLGQGANAQNLKPKDVANAIAMVLAEQQAAHTAVSHV